MRRFVAGEYLDFALEIGIHRGGSRHLRVGGVVRGLRHEHVGVFVQLGLLDLALIDYADHFLFWFTNTSLLDLDKLLRVIRIAHHLNLAQPRYLCRRGYRLEQFLVVEDGGRNHLRLLHPYRRLLDANGSQVHAVLLRDGVVALDRAHLGDTRLSHFGVLQSDHLRGHWRVRLALQFQDSLHVV